MFKQELKLKQKLQQTWSQPGLAEAGAKGARRAVTRPPRRRWPPFPSQFKKIIFKKPQSLISGVIKTPLSAPNAKAAVKLKITRSWEGERGGEGGGSGKKNPQFRGRGWKAAARRRYGERRDNRKAEKKENKKGKIQSERGKIESRCGAGIRGGWESGAGRRTGGIIGFRIVAAAIRNSPRRFYLFRSVF